MDSRISLFEGLEAEDDALILEIECLNMEETLKDHGFGLQLLPRCGSYQIHVSCILHATSWCSIHYVVSLDFSQKSYF